VDEEGLTATLTRRDGEARFRDMTARIAARLAQVDPPASPHAAPAPTPAPAGGGERRAGARGALKSARGGAPAPAPAGAGGTEDLAVLLARRGYPAAGDGLRAPALRCGPAA
jgi:hypothetical protein